MKLGNCRLTRLQAPCPMISRSRVARNPLSADKPRTQQISNAISHFISANALRHCTHPWQRASAARARSHVTLSASGAGRKQPPRLSQLCRDIQHGYFELCVQNNGRPAAAALTQVVAAAVAAFDAGFHLDRLRLELEHGSQASEGDVDAAGWRLTGSERHYRALWLDAVYVTLQLEAGQKGGEAAVEALRPMRPWVEGDETLVHIIRLALQGHTSMDNNFVTFDRSLATSGASGGVAADARTVAPQFIPISQLILLTLKLLQQQRA